MRTKVCFLFYKEAFISTHSTASLKLGSFETWQVTAEQPVLHSFAGSPATCGTVYLFNRVKCVCETQCREDRRTRAIGALENR